MTGTITRIERDKGYGFIRDSDGLSRFFRARDLAYDFDLVKEGLKVEFEPQTAPPPTQGNGLRAVQIMVVL